MPPQPEEEVPALVLPEVGAVASDVGDPVDPGEPQVQPLPAQFGRHGVMAAIPAHSAVVVVAAVGIVDRLPGVRRVDRRPPGVMESGRLRACDVRSDESPPVVELGPDTGIRCGVRRGGGPRNRRAESRPARPVLPQLPRRAPVCGWANLSCQNSTSVESEQEIFLARRCPYARGRPRGTRIGLTARLKQPREVPRPRLATCRRRRAGRRGRLSHGSWSGSHMDCLLVTTRPTDTRSNPICLTHRSVRASPRGRLRHLPRGR